jgi:hypothetical protein
MRKKKKTFLVPVTRIGYGYNTFEVEASSQKEADEIALEQAGDHEFSEKDADYVLENSADKNDRMGKYLKSMDFKLLKEQKHQLIKMQTKMEKGQKLNQKDWDVLEGMINFCDSIQDIAVDEYGYDKRSVYRLTKDK